MISTKQLNVSSFHTGVANSANYDQLFVNIIIDVVCEDRGVGAIYLADSHISINFKCKRNQQIFIDRYDHYHYNDS